MARCRTCKQHYDRERLYGLSEADYQAMLVKQGGHCAICDRGETVLFGQTGKLKALAVDHSHRTGAVRGLLCAKCNKAIGLFNEDIHVMLAAIAYLQGSQDED